MPKMKIKSGDTVLIQIGKDRGKTGKVLAAFPSERRIIVEGRNLVKRHVRPRRAGEKGQRIEAPAPFPVDRVLLVCPSCQKATRIGIQRHARNAPANISEVVAGAGGVGKITRERVCKKCGVVIP